jgi:NAD dependent epimerase/dehydratase family
MTEHAEHAWTGRRSPGKQSAERALVPPGAARAARSSSRRCRGRQSYRAADDRIAERVAFAPFFEEAQPQRPVLVTGGAGFIGSHTCDRLLSLGHEVIVLAALTRPVHWNPRPASLPRDRLLPGRHPQP